jgi:RNA polymerase sigma-70 factor (ECF subfamily)
LLYAARGDLLKRLGRNDAAVAEYRTALSLATVDAERKFLARRIEELCDPKQCGSPGG